MAARRWLIVFAAAALVGVAVFIFRGHRYLPFLSAYEVLDGPVLPTSNGVRQRQVYFIHAPFDEVKGTLRSYESGSGSVRRYSDSYGYGNYDSREAWMLCKGKGAWPEWPYLGDFRAESGTEEEWCTLAYASPEGLDLVELIRRRL